MFELEIIDTYYQILGLELDPESSFQEGTIQYPYWEETFIEICGEFINIELKIFGSHMPLL